VSESYIRLPADAAGKKLRTIKQTIGEHEVHEEVVVAEIEKALKTAIISCNTSSDNEIVAAVIGKRIKVYMIVVNFAGTVSAKWRSHETDLTGAMPFQAREGYTISVQPPAFLLQTVAGEALNLNLSDTIYAYGWIAYWDDDAE